MTLRPHLTSSRRAPKARALASVKQSLATGGSWPRPCENYSIASGLCQLSSFTLDSALRAIQCAQGADMHDFGRAVLTSVESAHNKALTRPPISSPSTFWQYPAR